MKKYLSFCKALLDLPKFLPVFFDNVSVYTRSYQPRRGPLFLSWDLSHACNLKCVHCHAWKQNKKGLTFDEKLSLLRQFGESGVFYLGLGGGEPLLDPHLGALIKEAKSKRMIVNISTNGFLLKERAQELLNSGVDFITISVDSHKPEIHDAIRGQTGLSEKIEKGIAAIKSGRHGLKPLVIIRCVVSRLNIDHLDEYARYWEQIADDVTFKPINENKINYSVPDNMCLLARDREKLSGAIKILLRRASFSEKLYYRKFPNSFLQPESLKKEPCFAGVFLADVDCEANLYLCGEERFSLGNLLENDFMKLWVSDAAMELRGRIKGEKRPCGCWSDCFLVNLILGRFLGAWRLKP